MSLDHAILGFLGYRALSGYDLKKTFDATVQHFWRADQSQIYRTLARLAEHGWARVDVRRQSDRPDRRVYHVTPAGRAELRRWLLQAFRPPQPHDAALVRLFFAGQLSDEELVAMFEETAAELRDRLRQYARLPRQVRAYGSIAGSAREVSCWELTLEAGIHTTGARLEWVERVLARLKRKGRNERRPAARNRGARREAGTR